MAINKRIFYTIITILLLAAATAALIISPALAEDEKAPLERRLQLSYVHTENDDVTYYCFDDALSVFADGEVTLISGNRGIYTIYDNVDGKKEILFKAIPADKAHRRFVRERDSEYLIVLCDGKIGTVGAEGEAVWLDLNEQISDFCVLNDTLYAISDTNLTVATLLDSGIGADVHTMPLVSDRHSKLSAKKVTAVSDTLFITVKAMFGNKWDVCAADISGIAGAKACALDTVLNQSNDVFSITSSAQTGAVYMLTRSEIIGYRAAGGWLHRTCAADGDDITDIYACGEQLLALDSLNALRSYTADLSSGKLLVASAGDANGFFNIPFGMAAKKSTLYAADTGNDRIAVYDGNGLRYIDRKFDTPVSVAADNAGTLYVAYGYNKVGIFQTESYSLSDEITVSSELFGRIRQIAVDTDKSLYVATDNGLWKVTNYTPTLLTATAYKSIALSVGKGNLYALSDGTIYRLDKTTGKAVIERKIEEGGISVAVDLNDTAFVLYEDKITSITSDSGITTDFSLDLDGNAYTLGEKSGQIMLCFMEDGLDSSDGEEQQNYLLVLDTFRHRILKADGNAIGARFVDFSYVSPDIVNDSTAAAAQNGIVYTVKFDTPLFNYPIETKSDYTVVAGDYVFMPVYSIVTPDYDPAETPEFALVLIDDTVNNRLIQGYVYKDALSKPVPYSAPPSEVCTITGELGTIVYKWPSRNAKAVDGYAEVEKNSKFTMLDFVESFRDGYGYYWYRIQLADGMEGYVPAVNVSTIDYQSANILPDYNAEIIAYKGKNYAKTYTLDDKGKYNEVLGVTLKAGTKVEVVGSFDSSERYTQIKYLDEKTHKTITCYVETVHVDYTGVNIVLIVALLVITITVILAVIIVSKVYYSKKKRLDNDEENEKN